MVWDFCSSFSRMFNLWPFSLEDFERAICHKDSNPVLIIESHATILRFLIKDSGEYLTSVQKKKRTCKVKILLFLLSIWTILVTVSVLCFCYYLVLYHANPPLPLPPLPQSFSRLQTVFFLIFYYSSLLELVHIGSVVYQSEVVFFFSGFRLP